MFARILIPSVVLLALHGLFGLGAQNTASRAPGSPASTFVSVTAGSAHFCGLDSTGDIYCWGDGQWGQLGDGGTASSALKPVRVQSFQHFRQVVAGATHTCALTDGGYPYCWGTDFSGVMADATVRERCNGSPCATRPMPVAIGFRFDSLAAGFEHMCGLRDSIAYCWGRNDAGQLGASGRMTICDGLACRESPAAVAGSLRFSSLVTRGTHTCGIASGTLWCWGSNAYGQISPDIAIASTSTPLAVSERGEFTQVSAAGVYTCGVTRAGRVDCWGANDRGRLGASDARDHRGVVKAPDGERFVRVSAGGTHTCALTTSGGAYCWGSNIDGRLGGETMQSCGGLPCSDAPVRVGVPVALTDIASGAEMTCATARDGSIYCWGGAAHREVTVAYRAP
jgi:alpha-tubulin suppressor-like RCC1 family protein